MVQPPRGPHIIHASAVSIEGRGLLITGASGSGKSSLALEMMALGADLVADDRVEVRSHPEGGLILQAPKAIRGLIEARGLGLLRAPSVSAHATAVVDLDQKETARLPDRREIVIAGVTLPLLAGVESHIFASMLVLYLKGGRAEP